MLVLTAQPCQAIIDYSLCHRLFLSCDCTEHAADFFQIYSTTLKLGMHVEMTANPNPSSIHVAQQEHGLRGGETCPIADDFQAKNDAAFFGHFYATIFTILARFSRFSVSSEADNLKLGCSG